MKGGVADTLTDMGTIYHDLGKFDQALDVYKQALQIQRETGDQGYEAQCLNNIASVYLTMGDNDNAFTYYQQALQVREKLGVPGDLAETLEGLSEAYTVDRTIRAGYDRVDAGAGTRAQSRGCAQRCLGLSPDRPGL